MIVESELFLQSNILKYKYIVDIYVILIAHLKYISIIYNCNRIFVIQ